MATCSPDPFNIFGCKDCAVCNDSYVMGPGFTCTKCSKNVWGISAAMMCSVVAVVVTFLVIKYVMSAEMGARGGILARMLRRVPLKSVKIVIVAWQILKKVSIEVPLVLKTYTV